MDIKTTIMMEITHPDGTAEGVKITNESHHGDNPRFYSESLQLALVAGEQRFRRLHILPRVTQ